MKLIKSLFISIALLSNVWAQSETFELANNAYENENYEQAIEQYKQLIAQGFSDVDLYFNLGNAYYKNQQVTWSILYFEKALKMDPSNTKIAHNLSLAYLKTKDGIDPLPKLFFVKWWHTLISKNSASKWGIKTVILAWITFAILLLRLFTKKKWLNYLATISIFLTFSFAFIAFQKHQFDNNHEMAIVMQNEVALKETPNENASTITILNEGAKLHIIDQVDQWSQVELEDGNTAWLKTISIERI